MTPKMTTGGYVLMTRALNGEGLTFTKIKIGNGEAPGDYKTLTELQNPLMEIGIEEVERGETYVTIRGTMSNADRDSGFFWTEIGIFAKDPDGGEDILYAYGHYVLSEEEAATYIPKYTSDLVEISQRVHVYVGDVESVTAIFVESEEYVSKATLEEHKNSTQPHPNMTAAAVGLGEVPNVDTDHQTPTYEVPNALSELKSGEILTTAMGKIAAAVKSLITHLANTAIHVTAADKTAWNGKAAASHNHSATNITSGTLGTARGGTGVTTYKDLAAQLASYFSAPTVGSYTGDGTSKRLIDLGFTPKAVILVDGRGRMCVGSATYGGVAVGSNGVRSASCSAVSHEYSWSSTHTALLIGTNGFYVNYASSAQVYTNTSGETYRYIAFA